MPRHMENYAKITYVNSRGEKRTKEIHSITKSASELRRELEDEYNRSNGYRPICFSCGRKSYAD